MRFKLQLGRYEDSERISKLGLAMPFSNSEVQNTTCKRLWSYNYMQCYDVESGSYALGYGTVWHEVLELLLNEYKATDAPIPVSKFYKIIQDNINRIIVGEKNYFNSATHQERMDCRKRILASIEGWRLNWEKNILPKFTIEAVEIAVCKPAMFNDNEIRYNVALVKGVDDEGEYLRPSYIGEAISDNIKPLAPTEFLEGNDGDVFMAEMVYWKVGKIDAVLKKRGTKQLWILDHKTTSKPYMYEKNLKFDYQMQKYAAMLTWEIQEGIHPQFKGMEVVGGIWDLCHSKVPIEVETIANGTKLSKSKSKSIPSYIYRQAVLNNGFDEKDYKDHIKLLKQTVDSKYFIIIDTYYTEKDYARCNAEDFMSAHELGSLRNALAAIDPEGDYASFCGVASRNNTICTQWGNCKYSQNCVANQPLACYTYTRRINIKWYLC